MDFFKSVPGLLITLGIILLIVALIILLVQSKKVKKANKKAAAGGEQPAPGVNPQQASDRRTGCRIRRQYCLWGGNLFPFLPSGSDIR